MDTSTENEADDAADNEIDNEKRNQELGLEPEPLRSNANSEILDFNVSPKRKRGRPRKSSVQSAPDVCEPQEVDTSLHELGATNANSQSLPSTPRTTPYNLRQNTRTSYKV